MYRKAGHRPDGPRNCAGRRLPPLLTRRRREHGAKRTKNGQLDWSTAGLSNAGAEWATTMGQLIIALLIVSAFFAMFSLVAFWATHTGARHG